MRVTIPDDVLDVYQTYADRQGVPLDQVLTTQLRRFRPLEPGAKAIVIPAKLLGVLEERLGGMPLKDGADLLARLTQLASISFGGIHLKLTLGQLQEIEHRARRQNKPVEQLVAEMVAVVTAQLFWDTGGGPAAAPVPLAQTG